MRSVATISRSVADLVDVADFAAAMERQTVERCVEKGRGGDHGDLAGEGGSLHDAARVGVNSAFQLRRWTLGRAGSDVAVVSRGDAGDRRAAAVDGPGGALFALGFLHVDHLVRRRRSAPSFASGVEREATGRHDHLDAVRRLRCRWRASRPGRARPLISALRPSIRVSLRRPFIVRSPADRGDLHRALIFSNFSSVTSLWFDSISTGPPELSTARISPA